MKRKIVRLRKLRLEDASLMLEWMHDEELVRYLRTDFLSMSLDDCEHFIMKSKNEDVKNIHLAVDVNGEYYGTVSLKNMENGIAEFAICMRRCAAGQGISSEGMKQMLAYGFHSCRLVHIYWCVSAMNKRAIRFYEKNGYKRADLSGCHNAIRIHAIARGYLESDMRLFIWYVKTIED